MGSRNDLSAQAVFGSTNRAGCVPDCLNPQIGPVYLEGRLVLSLSFQGGGESEELVKDADDVIERYRLWDDLAGTWFDSSLEVLRFEQLDAVVRLGVDPVILWKGAMNTRARVVLEPDLDEAGLAANQKRDLCWKRV